MEGMTIGQVARQTGVGIETLRFYEREALIPAPSRNHSGYRMYQPSAVERIVFIRYAKELGFSLAEIRELLFLRVDDNSSCMEIKEIAEDKISDIEERIAALDRMRDALKDLVRTCRPGRTVAECRILDSLLVGTFTKKTAKRSPNNEEKK